MLYIMSSILSFCHPSLVLPYGPVLPYAMPTIGPGWFRDRPLAQKFLVAFGALFLLLSLGFAGILLLVSRLNSYVERHQRITIPAVVTAGAMRDTVLDSRLMLETLASGRGMSNTVPERIAALYTKLQQDLTAYRTLHSARVHPILLAMVTAHGRLDLADEEDAALDRIAASLERWIDATNTVIAAAGVGRRQDLWSALSRADELAEQLQASIAELITVHIAIDREMKAEGDRLQHQATLVIAGLAVLLGAIIIAVFAVVTRAIARPLQTLAGAADRVAHHDLTASFDQWPAADEVGNLARSLSLMLANLRDRTHALERKTRELEAFTYSVAHDLKGPLREIEGLAGLVTQRAAASLPDDARRQLGLIRSAALRMTGLIDALLRYSRLEQQTLPTSRLNLAALVTDIVGERAGAGAVRVEVPPLEIHAEPTSLHQAIGNLLDNALKFSRQAAAPEIYISAARQHGTVRLWIRDNGIGFDPAHANRLFGLFERLHTDEEYEGTGVGLAIVKLVMDKHGGRVWAESSPGKGATFFLELPERT